MSIPVAEVVGSIESRHITEMGKNHYCCTWQIEDFFSYLSEEELKSPIFTVPNEDRCKWYLKLQFIRSDSAYNLIFHSSRLILDRESLCENTSVKFKLTILSEKHEHECNLDSSTSFKFVSKSDNSSGVLSSVQLQHIIDRSSTLTMVCEMAIETVNCEKDEILRDYERLLKNEIHPDVVLSVGEKKFAAHRGILSARSSVFAAMFAHSMVESQGVVQIKDMAAEVVEEMLCFIYTGEVNKFTKIARDLWIAADKYNLNILRAKCEKMLIDDLSNTNVLDVIAFAKIYNAGELKIKAMEFFLEKGAEIIKTPAWENLGNSDSELLKEIFEVFFQRRTTVRPCFFPIKRY